MNPRAIAAQCLYYVIYEGRSLTDVLQLELVSSLDKSDKALTKDMCFGSLRWHYAINQILDKLLSKPLKERDKDVECLLRVGLYQLHYQSTADYAAVNETVKASKSLKKPWSKGLINGVLRSFLRDQQAIVRKIKPHTVFPAWLIKRTKQSWPKQWKHILIASNLHAPMTLRVNLSKVSVNDYIHQLNKNGINARRQPLVDSAIELVKPVNVYQLPDFEKGFVSVQDASAQLAAKLLGCEEDMNVLDACAAPGGKTGHIAESCQNLKITAIDTVSSRLSMVKDNLDRLGKEVTLITGDASNLDDWYDGTPFDRILLDAPCSALGVMRRHPDIKVLRKESDIPSLLEQQKALLHGLWPILKPGGLLLYATCSILAEENDQQIAYFVATHSGEVRVLPLRYKWGIPCEYGRQILPDSATNMDGFYYALLEKVTTGRR